MKKQYEFLEIEISNLFATDVLCDNSSEPTYGSDSEDDWGTDIWDVIITKIF